jgi:hypothetical protein
MRIIVPVLVCIAHLVVFTLVIASLEDANTKDTHRQCVDGLAFNVTIANLIAYGAALAIALPLFLELTRKEGAIRDMRMSERRVIGGMALLPFAWFMVLATMTSMLSTLIEPDCKTELRKNSQWIPLDTSVYICIAMDCAWMVACVAFLFAVMPKRGGGDSDEIDI